MIIAGNFLHFMLFFTFTCVTMRANIQMEGIRNMKSTGIIRKIDELGRVVIPIELRNKFNLSEKDPIEIYVDGSSIILKKYESNCIFCGKSENLKEYKDKQVCDNCLKKLTSLSEKNKKTKK